MYVDVYKQRQQQQQQHNVLLSFEENESRNQLKFLQLVRNGCRNSSFRWKYAEQNVKPARACLYHLVAIY